jgi:hypothetical protein
MEDYPDSVAPDGRRPLFVRAMTQDRSSDLMFADLAMGGRT